MNNVNDDSFDKMVDKAIDNLPDKNLKNLDNVAIVVEDWPTPLQLTKGEVQRGTLFGLYEGIPKPQRGNNYSMVIPDKITIFKGPLTRAAVNKDHLQHLVDNTVWHEVAHHYGLGHGRIHQLEKKARTKKQFAGKIEYESSPLLDKVGINHGWFKRIGGVSAPPFESLNAAYTTGDRPEYVEENIRRALIALNLDRSRLVQLSRLAHSNKVFVAEAQHSGAVLNGYDAIITDTADLPISLNTADCMPIFVATSNRSVVGIIHAGWRGLKAGAICATIKQITQNYNVEAGDIIAGLGPAASNKSYEVKDDVASKFDSKYTSHKSNKQFLDLYSIANDQLEELGIKQIWRSESDTIEDKKFFSYRRENITGRNFNVIAL